MKKLLFTTLIGLFALSFSFSQKTEQDDGFITTPSGLKYKITEKGRGIKAEAGDKVSLHYTGKLTNDTVFDSSYPRKQPFTFTLGKDPVIKGWVEGVALLHQGDKATFIIPPELGYEARSTGKIPANSTLIFDVDLINVQKAVKITAYDTTGIESKTTETGLKYFEINNKKGKQATKGSRVSVHYTGYLKDGKIFDSSVQKGEPIKIELGANQVIKGWDEGLSLMSKGDKFRLIIPYQLAFGEKGRPPVIPEKAELTFDVELIDVLPPIIVEPFNIKGKKQYTTESGLKYIIVKETDGEKVPENATVTVHYTGYLDDGTIFDSSIKREQIFSFPLGKSKVIKGWDEGIALMKKGEKFRFYIPYNLAYGEKGYPPVIPAKAELTFDIELIDF